jgi:hypothetical protein
MTGATPPPPTNQPAGANRGLGRAERCDGTPNARTTANLLLASAAVAAAYVIVTRRPLRRLVYRMARLWLGASVLAYPAWRESGGHD